MKYQENKGKICQNDGCNNKAKVKGLCYHCYTFKRKNILRKEQGGWNMTKKKGFLQRFRKTEKEEKKIIPHPLLLYYNTF